MNSIRPLITITLLVCVGGYLYLKINEGPARPADGEVAPEVAEGVPPLTGVGAPAAGVKAPADGAAAAADTAAAGGGAAPAWSPPPAEHAATNEPSTATAEREPKTAPPVPAVPELPEAASTVDAPLDPTSSTVDLPAPTQLPDDIPVARYPGETAATDPDETGTPSAGSPSETAPSATANGLPEYAPPGETLAAAELLPHTNDLPESPITTPDATSPAPPASSGTDRYGLPTADGPDANTASPSPAAEAAESEFAESWPAIQTALERGELARAHKLLSQWYGDESLAPHEAEEVETLLSQLAGTVVYSTEHHVEPAHVVQTGETLHTIAETYDVPWQLLAKINGIPAAEAVEPGQQLKVVRGPFSAIIDLDRSELTLMLDGRYAGKFAIDAAAATTAKEGQWIVADRFDVPHHGKMQRALILKSPDASGAAGPPSVLLGAVAVERLKSLGISFEAPVVGLNATDADEVADILSIGSPIMIRR